MSGELTGRRVIVTGAAHGLGRAIAIAMVRAGAQVLFTARDKSALAESLAESAPAPGQALTHSADLADRTQVEGIHAAAKKAFGGVDVLVNNAGVSMDTLRHDYWTNPVRAWQEPIETYRRYFEINILSAIHLILLVLPEMRARKWGRIMSVTTSLNTMIAGGMGPYGPSKAALEAFTSTVAHDVAGSGVTANVLAPGGPADTRMIIADIPRQELIPADCLAGPAVWLASRAGDTVTGRRFLGSLWDRNMPPEKAAEAAGAPIAWTGYGVQSYVPKSKPRVE